MVVNARSGIPAPLSDLQYAYLLGEFGDFQLGGPALFYEEYSCPELDLTTFSGAIYQLMHRHEMLRATFDDTGLFHVHDELPAPVSYRSLRGQPDQICRRVLAASRERYYREGSPLGHRAPFDISVFALDTHLVVQVCGRLLAIDGFSGEIFAQELLALLGGESLPPLRYTFREYRRDFERRKESEEYARAAKYWLDRLDDLPAAPELPRRRLSGDPDPRLVRRTFKLPKQQWDSLAAKIKKNRLTGTMVLGTAFCEVLRHWSKSPDFTINIMSGERIPFHPDTDQLIGNFSITVLVECAAGAPGSTFLDRARTWRRQLLQDLEHSAFSGVSVIRELNQRHGNSRNALMPVVFTSMLGVGEADGGVFLEHLGWQRLEGRVRTPQVALDHQVFLADNALVISWDSADDLYPPGMIDDMFAAYRSILIRLATEDSAWQSPSFELTPPRQLKIRDRVNDTTAPAAAVTLHELFRQQADRHPDRVAVIAAGRELTYGRLRAQAGAIAAQLVAAGAVPGDAVGVQAARGGPQIAALLGVLMAGAAYVPISPNWPVARREQIAKIANLRLLLASPETTFDGVRTIDIADAIARDIGMDATPVLVGSEALAYVIFTSGTTGTPKGVMITHGSVANTVVDINERFGIGAHDRVLAVSDFTFDLSVWDIFGIFAAGGTVVLPEPGLEREVTHLYELCRAHGVTVWNSVPAYLAMFVDFVRSGGRPALPELRLAMVSGDWVPITLAAELATVAPHAACVSLGGATEASIWSNYFPIPTEIPAHWVSIPYGYPLRNQRFHVLDHRLLDRPDWVPGELFIAGCGLAAGYLDDPELTAAAFGTHPAKHERIYRTGDWARYWPDGTLEFLGREDPQVKVNGFRVELGEIEAALLSHPAVIDCAVVARADGRTRSLVAFVASQLPAEQLILLLKEHVAGSLPAYLVPQLIEVRPHLPLTANGKVDRQLLVELAGAVSTSTLGVRAVPRTDTERLLATIWAELLDLEVVGRFDDFFASGGSSLQAAQLMNRIEQRTGRRLPLATLYAAGTLDQLAARVDAVVTPEPAGSLITLADNGRPPLVLIHPVGGDLLCYRQLVAQLATRHHVLGLRSRPAEAGANMPTHDPAAPPIEDLATRYLTELAPMLDGAYRRQPVRLAGWSLGGVIAYEMARRLRRDGRECTVTLIDPWLRRGPNATPDGVTLVHAFLHNLAGTDLDLGRPPANRPDSAADVLRRIWNAPPAQLVLLSTMTFTELSALYSTFETNTRALLRYTATPEPGLAAEVIEAIDGLGGPAGGYLAPLRAAAPALCGVRFHRVDGDHFTLMDAGHAPEIADLICGISQ